MSQPVWLRIEGARQNNLKNVSVDIPHDRVTVVTGVSGSGKSSLAFDTLFAEGQWRYIESLSTYARMFLERLDRPDVDRIEHIRPAIALEQKNPVRPRVDCRQPRPATTTCGCSSPRWARPLPPLRQRGAQRLGRARGRRADRPAPGARALILLPARGAAPRSEGIRRHADPALRPDWGSAKRRLTWPTHSRWVALPPLDNQPVQVVLTVTLRPGAVGASRILRDRPRLKDMPSWKSRA
jgi:hypothetical protein